MENKKICIYSSSSTVLDAYFIRDAEKLSELLASGGNDLVFGGGMIGLMGVCGTVFRKHQRKVISVIPKKLNRKGIIFEDSTEIIETETMNERKKIMEDLSDAFIALPGGFGTIEELMEVITLKQLKYHDKAICILNTKGFYNNLIKQLKVLYKKCFAKKIFKDLYFVADKPEKVIRYLNEYKPLNFEEKFF